MKSRPPMLCRDRLRTRPPARFSWLDHHLVRHGYTARCSSQALALYLFLVTVGDRHGMSYYSDRSILKHLSLRDSGEIAAAREELLKADLIAYRAPYYQVLTICSGTEMIAGLVTALARVTS